MNLLWHLWALPYHSLKASFFWGSREGRPLPNSFTHSRRRYAPCLLLLITLNEKKPCSDLVGDVILGRGRCQLCDIRQALFDDSSLARQGSTVDMFQHPEFPTIASVLWSHFASGRWGHFGRLSWLGVVKVPSMLEVKVVIICLFRSSSGSMLTRFMENMALLELRQATLPWDNYTSCLLEIVILFSVFGF